MTERNWSLFLRATWIDQFERRKSTFWSKGKPENKAPRHFFWMHRFLACWRKTHQTGWNWGKGLMSTQQVCATSVGQKLCRMVHRGDNFHNVKAGVTFLVAALCVRICQCLCISAQDSSVSNLLHSHFRKALREKNQEKSGGLNHPSLRIEDGVFSGNCKGSL